MTIREKVALALHHARLEDDDVDIAITAFLAAAAEQGWHMRRDITGTGYTDEFEWDE